MKNRSKEFIYSLADRAGITINGPNSYDVKIHNENFYDRLIKEGAIGFGESYMDGWWDCDDLADFLTRLFRANMLFQIKNFKLIVHVAKSRVLNLQKISRAFEVGKKHYDVGNDLYKAMLDKRMLYTCAYWKGAKDLNSAQEKKLELICKKIELEKGMTILDLGCGFGAFAKYAAEKYDARVTGVTISQEQLKLGRELCKGLPVELELTDYRKVKGKFDRVISIGIMEHIGYKNYRTYMEKVNETLKDDGVAFFHSIGNNVSRTTGNAWVNKYVFPNAMLPSISQLGQSMEGIFVMEDWHNFGPDYDKTCVAWYDNFLKAWPKLSGKYDEQFKRMWVFYLLSCAAAFRSRLVQLWQVVMTKEGREQPSCRWS